MQQERVASSKSGGIELDCVFCQPGPISQYILKETPAFRVVADHAPLVEGHLLIMPRQHYPCYGDVPATLDAELHALKQEVARFLTGNYAPVVFWEHGVFRQTVFHAHMHCFPFGEIEYELSRSLHAGVVRSQDELRAWYATYGPYFYLEDHRNALVFSPQMDHYIRVVREVLYPHAATRAGFTGWQTPEQRREAGGPLIEAVVDRWRRFQQQEEINHGSKTTA